ncbi:hypothetical protein WH47_07881 [Habropoda laboriosa]|uniref:Uncharacterized protein n=1 Tax=Habropoda laboriosa TaxID=597456 RepID=A0A0L7RFS9_9HYME|nr:hypothetical protein WH47_07881 [Habropoda laboriosa]
MSMPTKGKHHLSQHHQHHSQPHHNPPQHQPQLIVNVNQPSVHSPQPYNTVITTNTPRFIPNTVAVIYHARVSLTIVVTVAAVVLPDLVGY